MPNPTANRQLRSGWRPELPPTRSPGSLPRGLTRPGRTSRGTGPRADTPRRPPGDAVHAMDLAHPSHPGRAVDPGSRPQRGEGQRPHRPQRRLPGNPASAIYGSIITASLLAVQTSYHRKLLDIIVLILGTLAVFWVAHAYTELIGDRVAGKPLVGGLRHALREEWPIVESGLLPVAVLLIASLFGAGVGTAVGIALAADVVELFGWGALAARRSRLPLGRAVLYSLVAGAFGLLLILLKVAVH